MKEDSFWEFVDEARKESGGDEERFLEVLERGLMALPPNAIEGFRERLDDVLARAYRWDLWAAAHIINGGASDDSFQYFRAWLVSRGERVYSAVTARPDELVDYLPEDFDELDFEAILSVAWEVYENKTGSELPASDRERPPSPSGEEWDFDDDAEVRKRLPRLYARMEADDGTADQKPWWRFW